MKSVHLHAVGDLRIHDESVPVPGAGEQTAEAFHVAVRRLIKAMIEM